MKVFIDGKYYDAQQAKISVFDHGLLYGDGVFEGIRATNGHVRLRSTSAALLFSEGDPIEMPMSREAVVRPW
jgi:branched-chain amino acid aminotransferase